MEQHERLYYKDGRAVEPASSLTRLAPVPPFSSSLSSSEDGERGVELLESKSMLKISCSLCHQLFSDLSSLREHMEWHERLYYEEISPAPPSSSFSFSSEDERAVEPASSLTRLAPAPPSPPRTARGVELQLERQAEALLAEERKRQARSSDKKKIHKRYACTICSPRQALPA